MQKLCTIFLYIFSLISCKQGELSSKIITALLIAHRSEVKPSVINKLKDKDHKVGGKMNELQQPDINTENIEEKQKLILKKKAQEAYTKFEDRLIKYKLQLINERSQLNLKNYELNIPFKKISPIFNETEQQEDIYAALGNDISIITDLEKILNILDLKKSASYTYGDTKVAIHFLNLLLKISEYTKKLINTHLSSTTLKRIKNSKSVEDIIVIYDLLEEFIKERENAIKTIQNQITSLASKKDKQAILDELKRTVGLNGSNGADIQKASYSIIKIVACMAYLVK
ncbi:hypothetical protein baBA2_000927 (plasmid) [Borrelia anserina]|uniref:Lipoprotein n=1 Tax=Borrelia anserina Es TaxID=1365188 RepID=A0ABM6FVP1_BORAN|nr:hypothetical protein [Borrelia anserina]APR65333.1 hypothetical protein N187_A14 [Borrelia anserina Es]UPA07301.1 hypothetical protein baBA2_000927 [Borrelia anserina]